MQEVVLDLGYKPILFSISREFYADTLRKETLLAKLQFLKEFYTNLHRALCHPEHPLAFPPGGSGLRPEPRTSQGPKLPFSGLPEGWWLSPSHFSMILCLWKSNLMAASAFVCLTKNNQVPLPKVTHITCEMSDYLSSRLINKFFKNPVWNSNQIVWKNEWGYLSHDM